MHTRLAKVVKGITTGVLYNMDAKGIASVVKVITTGVPYTMDANGLAREMAVAPADADGV